MVKQLFDVAVARHLSVVVMFPGVAVVVIEHLVVVAQRALVWATSLIVVQQLVGAVL